jgi:hypothetical protein
MYKLLSKQYRFIAIFLGIVLTAEIFLISMGAIGRDVSVNGAVADGNQEIAADISNMTGVTTEQIMKLKMSGMTWNEIIETLKSNNDADLQTGKVNRGQLLMNTGLSGQTVERLVAEGFSEQEITDAKLLAERVVFQLRELVQSADSMINESFKDQPLDTFKTVAEQFDLEAAVHFMLALKDEFGGYESVLDEYLSSLQLELSLETYLDDKEQYLHDKEIKRMEHIDEPTISLSEIERALLAKLQSENNSKREELSIVQPSEPQNTEYTDAETLLPDVPSPSAQDVKPRNPTQSVLEEINQINPNEPNNFNVKETGR